MALPRPRLTMCNLLTVLYAVVWAIVLVTQQIQGEKVSFDQLGWLVAGVVVIRAAFKNRSPDEPEGGGQA